MAIQIILLDLDGTLLNSQKQISPANYAALERAAAAGVHVVPSTGRFYDGMPQVVRSLPFVRYAITINGAQIYDVRERRVLHSAQLSWKQAEAVYDVLDTLPVIYDCFMDGWGYMDIQFYQRIDAFITDPRVNQMVKTLRHPVEDFRGYMRRQKRPVQKVQMFFRDMDRRAEAFPRLIERFPDLAVTSSITNNIELNERHANKGEALAFLCRHLGVDIRDTIAFGDGSNDRTMIEAAGVGVVMANGDAALRAAADYVTASNDEDGVARALERFGVC